MEQLVEEDINDVINGYYSNE